MKAFKVGGDSRSAMRVKVTREVAISLIVIASVGIATYAISSYFLFQKPDERMAPFAKVAIYIPDNRTIVVKVENPHARNATKEVNATVVETDIRIWPIPIAPKYVAWTPNETTHIPPGQSQLFTSRFPVEAFKIGQTITVEFIVVNADGTNQQIQRSFKIERWTSPG